MTTLYAQPYSLDGIGFYFDTMAKYQARFNTNRDRFGQPLDEYEIQMIEAEEDGDAELFATLGVDQCTLAQWFDEIEGKSAHEKAALFYLVGLSGYGVDDALAKIDEVCLSSCGLLDAATELFDECYAHQIPENLRHYIDYEAFANDCRCGGDMVEFNFAGQDWVCTNNGCGC